MHTLSIDSPCNLADHLRENKIPLKMSCGGHGSCKTCRVLLDGEPVLACQTDISEGNYDLTVPQSAASMDSIQIDVTDASDDLQFASPRLTTTRLTLPNADEAPYQSNRSRLAKHLPKNIALSSRFFDSTVAEALGGEVDIICFDDEAIFPNTIPDASKPHYAFAVDIGTTTIAAALIDLRTNKEIDCRGRLNAQYSYAEDLVARIAFCHTPELLGEMQQLVLRQTLVPLLRTILKENSVPKTQLLTTVLSGNAPMIHILLGFDPSGMGGWPFNGIDFAPPIRVASELSLPGKQVEFVPAQSAYLGGDIVSGLSLIDFEQAPDGTLFVDLGTNAEMAIKANGHLLCTAVPAGPAFEGGGFPCGVSAIPGAIDKVWNEGGTIKYSTIGNKEPVGLCGSGIISFVASVYRARVLRKKGRFSRTDPRIETRELLGDSQRVYPLTKDIYLSEDDISNFLQAKAAVFSGIITLCKRAELDIQEITTLHLAGNFGKRVDVQDLIDIGTIPPIDSSKVKISGNTSLKGAIGFATDRDFKARGERLVEKLEFVELNAEESFQDDFINALFIPHLKIEFPDTKIARSESLSRLQS